MIHFIIIIDRDTQRLVMACKAMDHSAKMMIEIGIINQMIEIDTRNMKIGTFALLTHFLTF